MSNWEQLATDLEQPLADAIADAVGRTANEEIALLALVYDDQRFAPPGVSFATTRERDGLLAGDTSDGWILATPADWDNHLIRVALDRDTAAKGRALEEHWAAANEDVPGDLSQELGLKLAAKLAGYSWPAGLARSDDFGVYAIDLEAQHLEHNVPLTMTAEQRATYRLDEVLGGPAD